jgi:beta-lactamase superfamily II metal-dependent hydrolase
MSGTTSSGVSETTAAAIAPVRLTALPAACGDCIVVEYGSGSDVHRILIDGGLGSKYDMGLGSHLSASGEPDFEIVIVTHVDRDHIDGVVHALRGQHLQIADIWFNGRDELDALVNGDTRGVRQGDELSVLIPAGRRNRVVDGKAIHVPPTGTLRFDLPGGASCTLLSPTRKRLEKLFDRWPDQLRVVDDPTDDLLTKLEDPLTRGLGEFGEDTSVANGSSIAVLFESGGASLLLTGDAYAADLEVTIGQLLAERNETKLRVDLFKLSHHGSRQNMTDGLLALIDPGAVLVCTDGSKFHHPDEDALEKVRSHYPEVPIHFTDDNEHIRQRAATVGARPPEVLPLLLHLGTAV